PSRAAAPGAAPGPPPPTTGWPAHTCPPAPPAPLPAPLFLPGSFGRCWPENRAVNVQTAVVHDRPASPVCCPAPRPPAAEKIARIRLSRRALPVPAAHPQPAPPLPVPAPDKKSAHRAAPVPTISRRHVFVSW